MRTSSLIPRRRLLQAALVGSVALAALPAFAQDTTEVSIWTAYGAQLQPAVDAYNAKMKAEGKNIVVVPTELTADAIADKFAVAVTSGDVPDVLDLDLVLAPKFIDLGALADITDQVAAAGLNDFNPKFLDLGVKDGQTYMIPFSADVSALFYNKDIFKAAGLDPEAPPKSWADFEAALQKIADAKLTAADGSPVYGFGAASDPGAKMFCDMPFAWTNGGNWLDANGDVILDSAESKAGVSFIAKILTTEGVAPPNPAAYTWDNKMNDLLAGRVAVVCTGSYAINEIKTKAADKNFGVMLFPSPKGDNPSSFIGGDMIGIPVQGKHPDEAWDFIQFALGQSVQVDIWAKNGMPSVRESLRENEFFNAEPRYYTFSDGVAVGQVPKTVFYNDFYEPWGTAWSDIYAGKPVDQALDEAAARMRDIIASQ
ncbi:MAG: ABC transporter substrate-binding protein [Devosia sp.]